MRARSSSLNTTPAVLSAQVALLVEILAHGRAEVLFVRVGLAAAGGQRSGAESGEDDDVLLHEFPLWLLNGVTTDPKRQWSALHWSGKYGCFQAVG